MSHLYVCLCHLKGLTIVFRADGKKCSESSHVHNFFVDMSAKSIFIYVLIFETAFLIKLVLYIND